jgi:hypothetical protein
MKYAAILDAWSNTGQILAKYWSNTGQILVKYSAPWRPGRSSERGYLLAAAWPAFDQRLTSI